jgi:hypothetical protein
MIAVSSTSSASLSWLQSRCTISSLTSDLPSGNEAIEGGELLTF